MTLQLLLMKSLPSTNFTVQMASTILTLVHNLDSPPLPYGPPRVLESNMTTLHFTPEKHAKAVQYLSAKGREFGKYF